MKNVQIQLTAARVLENVEAIDEAKARVILGFAMTQERKPGGRVHRDQMAGFGEEGYYIDFARVEGSMIGDEIAYVMIDGECVATAVIEDDGKPGMQNEIVEVDGAKWLIRQAASRNEVETAIAQLRCLGSVGGRVTEHRNGVETVLADVIRLNDDGTEAKPYGV